MAGPCLGVANSLSGKVWELRLDRAGDRLAEGIAQKFSLPEMTARVLAGRGIGEDQVADFLNPTLARDLPDPAILKDMEKGAKRLAEAIENKEKVAVFGDYDVDGATSSALLARYFRSVTDVPLEVYIPDRQREGYGPNTKALLGLKERGASVVIAVDCGTLSFEPLAAAKKAGLDVIVADHHKADSKLPEAFAVINPNRLDEDNTLGNLAAVGVVFLLVVALNRELRARGWFAARAEPELLSLLDLVALGTVADVVPLTGLNRTLVAQGLKIMARRENLGLRVLCDVARLDGPPNTYHLGFLLGPRVNAGGRVGEASMGAALLATEDEGKAQRLALALDLYNKERREIEAEVESEALFQAEQDLAQRESPLVMVAKAGWHPGVIGIVAGRLREKFDRPAIVFSIDREGLAKGSARSLPGVDIGAAVLDALHHKVLEAGGGHAMAAGLTVPADQLPALREFLENKLEQAVAGARQDRRLALDGVLSANGATVDLASRLEQLGPYGSGFPSPRFAFADLALIKSDLVGKNHVRTIFAGKDGGRIKGIAFRAAETPLGQALLKGRGKTFHLAGRLKRDQWQGVERVDIQIEDAAKAEL
ncbi:MAG: single-stranded-DNA-specific exonuclease RecJ [Proteobacteria bacterium]|nr:single-stranded-DNA-specific exonuclease RecJ [Pseudomonadota bacterium]